MSTLPKLAARRKMKALLAAYRADNPETLHQATIRKSQEHAARLPSHHWAALGAGDR